jgi:hypothetical protein
MSRTRGADADEHLDKVGAGDGEERHVGFARLSRDQRLASAEGRPTGRRRNAAAEPLELLRVAQKLDDLLQIGLGLVNARHVFERDAALPLGEQFGFRLAEAHGTAAARLHLTHEEDPYADQQ